MWSLLVAAIVGSLISAAASTYGNAYNIASQEAMNAKNLANQTAINEANLRNQSEINQQNIDFSREFAQNQISWRMEDLQNAGLNPVMAANGGNSSPISMVSTSQQATQQKPGLMDMSGISSAITALNNSMLTAYLIQSREGMAHERNDVLRSNNESRNAVLNQLYKRKGLSLNDSEVMPHIGTAKQAYFKPAKFKSDDWEKDWSHFLKELDKMK